MLTDSGEQFIETDPTLVLPRSIAMSKKHQRLLSVGYRHMMVDDNHAIIASVSKENLFNTFISLLDLLKGRVDVVLETSHDCSTNNHVELWSEKIDLVVLKSYLYDFEDLIVNDGSTGIAVVKESKKIEIQLIEDKVIVLCSPSPKRLKHFESALVSLDIFPNQSLVTTLDVPHGNRSTKNMRAKFYNLCQTLGIDVTEGTSM